VCSSDLLQHPRLRGGSARRARQHSGRPGRRARVRACRPVQPGAPSRARHPRPDFACPRQRRNLLLYPAGHPDRASDRPSRPRRLPLNVNTAIFVAVVALALLISRRGEGRPWRMPQFWALVLLLLLAPKISDNISVLTPVMIGVMLGAGWNIIGGYTGYASFGQVAFFGLGGY